MSLLRYLVLVTAYVLACVALATGSETNAVVSTSLIGFWVGWDFPAALRQILKEQP